MKLYEYLSKLDKKETEEIGNNLEVIDKFDMGETFSTSYIISLIINNRLLNKKYMIGLLKNKEKFKFDDAIIREFKRMIFDIQFNKEKNLDGLKRCGLIISRNEIAEDLKEMLLQIYKIEPVTILENPNIQSKHTLFLKLCLFINEINFNKNFNKNIVNNLKCNHGGLIISYLNDKSIINIEDERITFNLECYNIWLSNIDEAIKDFYCYVFEKKDKKRVEELFFKVMFIQADIDNWIKVDEIEWLTEAYEEEYEFALDIGLIIKAEKNNKYIKLHNDVIILLDKDIPRSHIVVTEDFQVFIEYKDDPEFILMLSNFAKLKNKFYNDDYFLFFDISEEVIKSSNLKSYDKFFTILKEKCSYIPDLVNEKFIEICK